MTIRKLVGAVFATLVFASFSSFAENDEAFDALLTVHKSPTCGCCEGWISHLEARGFETEISHPENLNSVKDQLQIPASARSCHTGVSEQGYVFEGHIPAHYIRQFLANPPTDGLGLVVPGMPAGSPGMEMGDRFTPYEVLLLKNDGTTEVYGQVETAASQY